LVALTKKQVGVEIEKEEVRGYTVQYSTEVVEERRWEG
jgi:biotin operon repressor